MINLEKFREYTIGEKEGESFERELFGVVKNVGSIEEERKKIHERMKREMSLQKNLKKNQKPILFFLYLRIFQFMDILIKKGDCLD